MWLSTVVTSLLPCRMTDFWICNTSVYLPVTFSLVVFILSWSVNAKRFASDCCFGSNWEFWHFKPDVQTCTEDFILLGSWCRTWTNFSTGLFGAALPWDAVIFEFCVYCSLWWFLYGCLSGTSTWTLDHCANVVSPVVTRGQRYRYPLPTMGIEYEGRWNLAGKEGHLAELPIMHESLVWNFTVLFRPSRLWTPSTKEWRYLLRYRSHKNSTCTPFSVLSDRSLFDPALLIACCNHWVSSLPYMVWIYISKDSIAPNWCLLSCPTV